VGAKRGRSFVSTALFAAAHPNAIVDGTAWAVYNSNGKLSDVLLDSLGQEGLSFSEMNLSSDQLKEVAAV
jgi:hypothetical protein